MPRLFVALSLPNHVSDALLDLQSGVEGARWRTLEHFHVTLSFIGETDRHGMAEADSALQSVSAPAFDLRVAGAGFFGDRKPRALWAGVQRADGLMHLQTKVERALRHKGFDLERRKFTPHVTLAYLKGARRDAAATWTARHGLFAADAFTVDAFHLYSSSLGGEASHYEIEVSYPLSLLR